MTHTIETLKELHEQRFTSTDKAIVLAASELARRLEVLNHAHELAREKERDFIGREAFDTFVLRVADDFAMFRWESQTAVITTTGVRDTAIKTLGVWPVDIRVALCYMIVYSGGDHVQTDFDSRIYADVS
jgi:hypothetical protein